MSMHTKSPAQKNHRRGREPRARNPGRGKGQERHREEMEKINSDQSEHRRTCKSHQVMVVDPDNRDKGGSSLRRLAAWDTKAKEPKMRPHREA
jgi:hypothetical protein